MVRKATSTAPKLSQNDFLLFVFVVTAEISKFRGWVCGIALFFAEQNLVNCGDRRGETEVAMGGVRQNLVNYGDGRGESAPVLWANNIRLQRPFKCLEWRIRVSSDDSNTGAQPDPTSKVRQRPIKSRIEIDTII